MRILHINSYYSTSAFYRELFEQQLALGEQISVFVPVPRGYDAQGRDFGDYTKVCPDHGKYDRLWFPLKHDKIFRDVKHQYDTSEFDVLHAHSLFSNGVIAWRLHRLFGTPYIVAVRDTDVNTFFAKMPHLRKLGQQILRDASRVVFLSKPYRDYALAPYLDVDALREVQEKSEIIPNGIDPFWLQHAPDEIHVATPGIARLLLVGRASKRKNVEVALAAAQRLSDQGTQVQFDVVIGKVEDPAILDRIRSHPLVTLHRNLTREQLLPLYRAADVFVLPSLQETFGLVYAEAMSQGLPVIYTRGQGFDGQFEEGEVGYAADPNDPREIASRIEDVLEDHANMAQRALTNSKRYDWARFAAQYDGIYREVIGRD
ncbi:glycosyltransferase family 4 protein [Eubacteriales bacterium OttesenSCG-928-N13]|nr:glycosyltransferase family 4 protein [Eubacteriales bacterium OttesenSCG-928-N13]